MNEAELLKVIQLGWFHRVNIKYCDQLTSRCTQTTLRVAGERQTRYLDK
jgi:hypothetical protein